MIFWIIYYYHKYGYDVWPVFQEKEPTEEEIAAGLTCYESDREDEGININGPFKVPAEIVQ